MPNLFEVVFMILQANNFMFKGKKTRFSLFAKSFHYDNSGSYRTNMPKNDPREDFIVEPMNALFYLVKQI